MFTLHVALVLDPLIAAIADLKRLNDNLRTSEPCHHLTIFLASLSAIMVVNLLYAMVVEGPIPLEAEKTIFLYYVHI